mgnify:CR=1 FL=1
MSRGRVKKSPPPQVGFAYALCRRFGIRFNARRQRRRDRRPFAWDGESLAVNQVGGYALHEIAHWIVAAPARRHLSDFGLLDLPRELADEEEKRAMQMTRLFESLAHACASGVPAPSDAAAATLPRSIAGRSTPN